MSQSLEKMLNASLRTAARSHIRECAGGADGVTAIYTLADPRDVRCARYVGQTRSPRRRYTQHMREARLWLPGETPWWISAPQLRPLYVWIRELYGDGGRMPFMWIEEWLEPGADARVAERAAIMRRLAEGAALLNVEARLSGAQLSLL
jgi:hypothetical protein